MQRWLITLHYITLQAITHFSFHWWGGGWRCKPADVCWDWKFLKSWSQGTSVYAGRQQIFIDPWVSFSQLLWQQLAQPRPRAHIVVTAFLSWGPVRHVSSNLLFFVLVLTLEQLALYTEAHLKKMTAPQINIHRIRPPMFMCAFVWKEWTEQQLAFRAQPTPTLLRGGLANRPAQLKKWMHMAKIMSLIANHGHLTTNAVSATIIHQPVAVTHFSCHPDQRWPTSGPQPHQWAQPPFPGQSCCQCRPVPAGHSCSAGGPIDDGALVSVETIGSKLKNLIQSDHWNKKHTIVYDS